MERVPKVSQQDVERVVRREFPSERTEAIREIVTEAGATAWRVHLAILKLSEGSIERLRAFTDLAKHDFRDVIAPAEYPGMCQLGLTAAARLPPDEKQRLLDDDWKQYCDWLVR